MAGKGAAGRVGRAVRAMRLAAGALCTLAATAAQAIAAPPDLVLEGELRGADHQTYREVPFEVPAGTRRITVEFDYSGREDRTTVDLGLIGPDGFLGRDGFRGWSGGNKRRFSVAATDATPSYQPGPLQPGRWALLLGLPNVRPQARDRYIARIWFNDRAPAPAPLRDAPGWYRGDLHAHDAHSDAGCASQAGQRVPCPLFKTVQHAAERGLDFIALTDHNTVSQANALAELQPYYDRVLLLPGREVTTFSGHGNLIGPVDPLDFRVGSEAVPDWNHLLRAAAPMGGVFAINHPIRPSDETCMGCGWTAAPPVDYALVQAVEAVNGADADTPYSGIPFWERLLDAGHRVTAIGGSDNHDATLRGATPGGAEIGTPATVVHARTLSAPGILDGIRAGRAFVDVQGDPRRGLRFSARAGAARAEMGDALAAPAGAEVGFEATVTGAAGGRAQLIEDGRIVAEQAVEGDDAVLRFPRRGDGRRHWVRLDVRGADGRLWLLGNPIYVNHDAR
ncbi:CehA/McbA family metallohydrolase [Luteimonas sp. Y-2-2-4F]|nr:CehA/McbA family metallohydrolase [Luteimonas sp. Y-2-2-4F]MCD9030875.1 CehA/McbA family metallohydrolase [Luteimonas sp. Y-2-2-4F]